MTQVIKLSDKAADRIKEILSENKDSLSDYVEKFKKE